MESKLKSLKVIDLKQILTKVDLPPPAKANKADLINRILASPAAIDAYNVQYPSSAPVAANDDLLAPPEDLDWTVDDDAPAKIDEPVSEPVSEVPAKTADPPAATSASAKAPDATESATASAAPETATVLDPELEKRKKRAERFGIALVEPKRKQTPAAAKKSAPLGETDDKLKGRAERFGLKNDATKADAKRASPPSKRKRGAAVPEVVDPEESERRRKRAERFGTAAKPTENKA